MTPLEKVESLVLETFGKEAAVSVDDSLQVPGKTVVRVWNKEGLVVSETKPLGSRSEALASMRDLLERRLFLGEDD